MEWFFILVLGGVAVWQGARIGALSARVRELETRLARAAEPRHVAPPAPVTEPAPQLAPAPPLETQAPEEDEEPLLLDQPLPPDEQEPLLLDQPITDDELLLDTPLPEASNDDEPPAEEAQAAPIAEPARLASALRARDFRFDEWLADKGFPWIAGSALTLGAIFLASFAAQQRWLTPQVQLACALALGGGLLGASEWARRVSLRTPPGLPLVAALLAGAGVMTFYAAAWAAHGIHNFIDYTTAAALLSVCALILIGLSFLHGQAIGVLAIVAALLAPPLTHEPLWPSLALTLYITAVGVAGFALAALRRWGWVALAALAGLYFWFWASIAVDDIQRALLLLSVASFGAVALALRTPLKDESPAALSWRRVHALGPTLGIAVSSVFLVWVWSAIAPAEAFRVMGPAIVSASHVALAAYAVRERFASAPAVVAAIAALVLGAITYLRAREYFGPLDGWHYGSLLAVALVVVICALSARPHREWRVTTAASGAIGAALLTALAVFTQTDFNAFAAWAPLFGGALLLFGAAWHVERDASPRTDRVIDFWAGAGAALVLLGVESAFPAEARATAHAGAALMFASAFAWRGWRVLRYAALAAAVITIAHALSPSLFGAALTGEIPIWGALVVQLAAAALLFGAAYFLAAGSSSIFGEAVSIAGAGTMLVGVALLLRRFEVHPSVAYGLVVIGAVIFARWRAPGVYSATIAPLIGVVRYLLAWLARTLRPGPKPTDLLNITPGARREKRYGRRRRTQ